MMVLGVEVTNPGVHKRRDETIPNWDSTESLLTNGLSCRCDTHRKQKKVLFGLRIRCQFLPVTCGIIAYVPRLQVRSWLSVSDYVL